MNSLGDGSQASGDLNTHDHTFVISQMSHCIHVYCALCASCKSKLDAQHAAAVAVIDDTHTMMGQHSTTQSRTVLHNSPQQASGQALLLC